MSVSDNAHSGALYDIVYGVFHFPQGNSDKCLSAVGRFGSYWNIFCPLGTPNGGNPWVEIGTVRSPGVHCTTTDEPFAMSHHARQSIIGPISSWMEMETR